MPMGTAMATLISDATATWLKVSSAASHMPSAPTPRNAATVYAATTCPAFHQATANTAAAIDHHGSATRVRSSGLSTQMMAASLS